MNSRLPLLALLLVACASASGGEKGGLRGVTVSPAALSKATEPRRFALVVGISDFGDDRWRDLRYAAKDARDVAAALSAADKGRFEKVVLLTTPAETSRARILVALADLAREANRPDDVVVVYFSAHGTLARDGKGELKRYLVTSDAYYRDVAGTALAIDALKARLDQFASKRRLLVLATCHSGGGKSLLPEDVLKELEGIKSGFYARPLEEVSRAAIVLSASDWGETAREDDSLQNDIYTHFLLDALSGDADRNGDGAVSAYEAHDHARRRTFAFTGGRQRPSAEIVEVGADPILLSGRIQRAASPELYSYNPRFDGFTLKVDGEQRAEFPGGAAVPAGKRKIELTKGDDTVFTRHVTIAPGQRLDLDTLLVETQPRRAVYLSGGAFTFLSGDVQRQVMPASLLAGASVRFDRFPARPFSVWAELMGSAGRRRLDLGGVGAVPFDLFHLNAAVSVPYTVHAGRFRAFAGPRVSALYLQRTFGRELLERDRYLTFSPGLMAGATFAATDVVEVSLQGHWAWNWLRLDADSFGAGSVGGWAGVGYRF